MSKRLGWLVLSIVLVSIANGVLNDPPAWRFSIAFALVVIAASCGEKVFRS